MSPHKLRSGRLVCSSSRMCTFSRAVCTTVGEHIAVVVGPCAGTCTPSVVRAGLRLRAGISAGPLDTVGVAVLRGATWVISLRGSPFAGEEYAPEDEGSICGLLFVGKGYCPELRRIGRVVLFMGRALPWSKHWCTSQGERRVQCGHLAHLARTQGQGRGNGWWQVYMCSV